MSAGMEDVDDKTKVVYIDDNIEAAGLFEDAFTNFTAIDLREPEWAKHLEKAFEGAELIITDWNLDGMNREPFLPEDGKALNEVLRAKSRRNPENPLYTIFSGRLSDVPDLEHHLNRPHILAQDLDADWVGSKDKGLEFRHQLLLLCRARRQLRENPAPPEQTADYWRLLFGIGTDLEWSEEAISDVDRFQPPVQHLYGDGRDERIFLRWMTRLVSPYPTFLLDSYEVAIRLRLDPREASRLLSDEASGLSRALVPVQYKGILAGFTGERWWRAGISDWIWRATDGNAYDPERVREKVMPMTDGRVAFLEERDPVLLRDERGRLMEDDLVADASQAVRIQPDEWPASAPWPWARIVTILRDPIMRAIVLPDDQHVLMEKS
jgi:hypothetical protein